MGRVLYTTFLCIGVIPALISAKESLSHSLNVAPDAAGLEVDPLTLSPEDRVDALLQNRDLQSADKYEFCGFSYSRGTGGGLLVNVDEGTPTLEWDEFGDFDIVWKVDKGTLTFKGEVQPEPSSKYGTFEEGEMVLEVDIKFSEPVGFDSCYCASTLAPWVSNVEKPDYTEMQKDCRYEVYNNRPAAAEDLYFCPKCENRLCNKASNGFGSSGAPKPVYRDWTFYTKVEGTLSGPGLALFRQVMIDTFPDAGLKEDIKECTLDITSLPLPQFSCNTPDNPFDGYGYGVNGKNQNCGFATWFKCKEDEDVLSFPHIADFNLEILPCRTFAPTRAPVRSPTPEPTRQPTINAFPPTPEPGCCFWFGLNEQECLDNGGELGDFDHCVDEFNGQA